MRLLILAGTREARALARDLADQRSHAVIVSLAGAVARPAPQDGRLRIGGFGGAEGLAAFLHEEAIEAVIDATHPFAQRISANAVKACAAARVPLLRLERPRWRAEPGDRWIEVADLAAAVAALPPGARPFLAIGRQEIGAFAGRSDLACLMRMIDPPAPDQPLPRGRLVLARPSGDPDAERRLLAEHGATHVVAKNSGGAAGAAKIAAARDLGLPVILVSRPRLPRAETVADVAGALAWIADRAAQGR